MAILLMPCKYVLVPFSIYCVKCTHMDPCFTRKKYVNVPSMHPIVKKVYGCLEKKKSLVVLGNHKTNLSLEPKRKLVQN